MFYPALQYFIQLEASILFPIVLLASLLIAKPFEKKNAHKLRPMTDLEKKAALKMVILFLILAVLGAAWYAFMHGEFAGILS